MTIPNTLEFLMALKANPFPHAQYLVEKFRVTEATIDQWIILLADLNLLIMNYQWHTCFVPIDISKLQQTSAWENLIIDYRMSMPSTHLYLKEDKTPIQSPLLCLAEHQSSGVGQRQKSWASPFGNNLYFSLKIKTKRRPQQLSGLSLVIALSTIKAIQMPELKIKWPNDIYVHHQKLAGILIDLIQSDNVSSTLIISIGINVNQVENLLLDTQWTSLQKITGNAHDRTSILVRILQQLKLDIPIFEEQGFSAFKDEWQRFDILYNQEVVLTQGDKELVGKAQGVDDMGHLLLQHADGSMHVNFGQASIKPQG